MVNPWTARNRRPELRTCPQLREKGAVDNSSFARMPPEVKPIAEKLPTICIDHHVTNDGTFGGGGHRKAAGCTIKATMGSAKRQMRAAVKELLKSACRKTMRITGISLK